MRELNKREEVVLNSIVQHFIRNAQPVSSRQLAKQLDLGISPATIRNVMMELEDLGLIDQPHKSAGRLPSDAGYRWYVDHLRQLISLTPSEEHTILQQITPITANVDQLLRTASQVVSELSHQVGLVLAPRLEESICQQLNLVELASNRILMVINFQSGLIKTLVMDLISEIPSKELVATETVLNERLAGLTLREIRDSMQERLKGTTTGNAALMGVFMETAQDFMQQSPSMDLHVGDFSQWVEQPEFENAERLRQGLDLLNNTGMMIEVLRQRPHSKETTVTIGQEHANAAVQPYSLVTSEYSVGNLVGIVGILGPRRMEYSKIIPVVKSTAAALSNVLRVH